MKIIIVLLMHLVLILLIDRPIHGYSITAGGGSLVNTANKINTNQIDGKCYILNLQF